MRNEDKRSGMSSKDKIQWIKKICNDKLYIRTAKNCKTHSKILGILQKFMNGKKYGLCRLMGIGTNLVKVYFKNLYVSMTKQGGPSQIVRYYGAIGLYRMDENEILVNMFDSVGNERVLYISCEKEQNIFFGRQGNSDFV